MMIAYVVGGLSCIAIWIIAVVSWGLLGIVFGWIPGLIGGAALGFLWPITVIAVLWIASQV